MNKNNQYIIAVTNQIAGGWIAGDRINLMNEYKKAKMSGACRKQFTKQVFEFLESKGLYLYRMPRAKDNMDKNYYLVINIAQVMNLYGYSHQWYTPPIEN